MEPKYVLIITIGTIPAGTKGLSDDVSPYIRFYDDYTDSSLIINKRQIDVFIKHGIIEEVPELKYSDRDIDTLEATIMLYIEEHGLDIIEIFREFKCNHK